MRILVACLWLLLITNSSCKKEFPALSTQVIGHAGESLLKSRSKYPPNSLESIKRAIELGAQGVEVDVQMTADSVLVAYHDLQLDENSDGIGCINSLSYEAIKNIEVYKTDERIDLLSDIFLEVLGKGSYIFLDVKHWNDCSASTIDYTLFDNALNTLLLSYSPPEKGRIVVNCRDSDLLNAISDSALLLSYETDDVSTGITKSISNEYDMISVKLEELDQSEVDMIKQNGIQFSVYNIKTRSEIHEALDFAPDFVISDNISCSIKAINGKE
jgi:glycerophosphoryl diester phosphodiesterase